MNYHLRSRNRKDKNWILYLIAAVIVFVVVLFQFFPPRFLSSGFSTLTKPVFSAKEAVKTTISTHILLLHSKRTLIESANRLHDELLSKRAAIREAEILQKENYELKRILGRVPNKESVILAAVLSKPPASPYDTFLIDIGADHKVQQGSIVRTGDYTVIGRVVEVYTRSSLARLYSSPGERVEVVIGEGIGGVAVGKGFGNLEVRLPKGGGVKPGDTIVLAGISTEYFGAVETIDSDPTDSFERVLFKAPVSLSTAKYVLVEKQQ